MSVSTDVLCSVLYGSPLAERAALAGASSDVQAGGRRGDGDAPPLHGHVRPHFRAGCEAPTLHEILGRRSRCHPALSASDW